MICSSTDGVPGLTFDGIGVAVNVGDAAAVGVWDGVGEPGIGVFVGMMVAVGSGVVVGTKVRVMRGAIHKARSPFGSPRGETLNINLTFLPARGERSRSRSKDWPS